MLVSIPHQHTIWVPLSSPHNLVSMWGKSGGGWNRVSPLMWI